jgi:hypothetical protein
MSFIKIKIDAGRVQDAYHYALAAAGDDLSEFSGRNKHYSRSTYLRMAVKKAREAGLIGRGCAVRSLYRSPLSMAPTVARIIRNVAHGAGIDAYTGEFLKDSNTCPRCGARCPANDFCCNGNV